MGSGGSKSKEVKTNQAATIQAAQVAGKPATANMSAEEKAKHEKLVNRIEQQQVEMQKAAAAAKEIARREAEEAKRREEEEAKQKALAAQQPMIAPQDEL